MNHIDTAAAINESSDPFPKAPLTLAEMTWPCWAPVDSPELPQGGVNGHVPSMSSLQTGYPPSSLLWDFAIDASYPKPNTLSSDAAFLRAPYAPQATLAAALTHQPSPIDPSTWATCGFPPDSEPFHRTAEQTTPDDLTPTAITSSPDSNQSPVHTHNEPTSETRPEQPKRRPGRPRRSLDDFLAGKGSKPSSYQSRLKVRTPGSLGNNKSADVTGPAGSTPSHHLETSIPGPSSTSPTTGSQKHRRNRAAALRYRHKIQTQQQSIEEQAEKLSSKHQFLKEHLDQLRSEVYLLHNELFKHSNCNCPLIHDYLAHRAHQLLSSTKSAIQDRTELTSDETQTERKDADATPE
ncbi:hypothetical protein QBC40DRAFT_249030 [Triangularia verruculosa]|uniref:BZIP domain-containing protein n=1 Tax=Triangularia verruculosa TaxID=2587418 RepID=A0AAN6XXE3_9PEZI|nr:hypothetical protein QBC40DRAFT_249030 [Triangularia verruculosa]